MYIILENVVVGLTTTGVAKVMEDVTTVVEEDGNPVTVVTAVNVTNVPFNVSSKAELDVFIDRLMKNQVEFAGLTDGAFTVTPVPVPEVRVLDPIEVAYAAIVQAEEKRSVNAALVTQAQIDALVATYKAIVTAGNK